MSWTALTAWAAWAAWAARAARAASSAHSHAGERPTRDGTPPVDTMQSLILSLRTVRTIHTLAWAFFAGCILAIPIAAWLRKFDLAVVLIAIVLVEVAILLANGMRCPLTAVAARFTDDRRDNFDIYLPLWLARYNKLIFGWLFVAGLAFTLVRWMGWLG